jgi:hypothetical protein
MNADLAVSRPRPLAVRASDRLQETSRFTRALLFSVGTLSGAVLYLVVNWPSPQAPVQVAMTPMKPAISQPPPAQAVAAKAGPPGSSAGAIVAEGIRAASAVSRTFTLAQTTQPVAVARAAPAAVPIAPVAASATVGAASVAVSSAGTAVPPAGAVAASNSVRSTVSGQGVASGPSALDVAGDGPRQTISAPTPGPNRISVPGAPASPAANVPAVSTGAGPPSPRAGANRITVPGTPPP